MIDHSSLPIAEGTARMGDGTLLRTLHWPAADDPWAMALIVHGLAEHAGRYPTVAAALTEDRIDVHGYDLRGFGRSAGRRGHIDRWEQHHDDLEARITALRSEQPGLPMIIWGHSLGGLIACGYVVSPVRRPLPDLLVLSSPAIAVELPAWKRALVASLANVLPHMRVSNGRLSDGLSHDPAIGEAYERDPLLVPASTTRFGYEGLREQQRVREALAGLASMPVPTYVLHGSADPIVPVSASLPFATIGNTVRHVHEGLRHETHHEQEHEIVLGEAVAWIDGQRAGLAAAREARLLRGPGVDSNDNRTVASGERESAESVVGPQTRGT
jgi:alpha-beta hydrolase superfamily lysophospholipase